MSYKRTNWVNNQTPLNADNLNNIEDGIEENKTSLNSKVDIASTQTITGQKTFTAHIKNDEIDNTNGNAMVRYKSTENKVVLGGSTIPTTIMGSGDRPTYSKNGSDFTGNELALLSDVIKMNATIPSKFDFNTAPSGICNVVYARTDAVSNEPPNYVTGSTGMLITTPVTKVEGVTTVNQQLFISNYSQTIASRVSADGVNWQSWRIHSNNEDKDITIEIGSDKTYTTLKSGFNQALLLGQEGYRVTVIVYPGTYDLMEEFATEIANMSGSGIKLGYGVKAIFMGGSYVKANFTDITANNARWVYENFEPFAPYNQTSNASFEIDGINIEASNTKYCVHDELGWSGNGSYKHIYRNCVMKYTTDWSDKAYYTQAIGGGLGEHGYIEIIGGKYQAWISVSETYGNAITYHNSYLGTAESKIFINNVYIYGRFSFGMYGSSTAITPIYVSNCSMDKAIVVRYEDESSYKVTNFELLEYLNEIRE